MIKCLTSWCDNEVEEQGDRCLKCEELMNEALIEAKYEREREGEDGI